MNWRACKWISGSNGEWVECPQGYVGLCFLDFYFNIYSFSLKGLVTVEVENWMIVEKEFGTSCCVVLTNTPSLSLVMD